MKVLSVINNDKDAVTKEYVDSKAGVTAVDPTSGPVETDFFIPTKTSDLTNDSGFITEAALATKQDTLVSGTNIKTINNESLLGSGNISIQGVSKYSLTELKALTDPTDDLFLSLKADIINRNPMVITYNKNIDSTSISAEAVVLSTTVATVQNLGEVYVISFRKDIITHPGIIHTLEFIPQEEQLSVQEVLMIENEIVAAALPNPLNLTLDSLESGDIVECASNMKIRYSESDEWSTLEGVNTGDIFIKNASRGTSDPVGYIATKTRNFWYMVYAAVYYNSSGFFVSELTYIGSDPINPIAYVLKNSVRKDRLMEGANVSIEDDGSGWLTISANENESYGTCSSSGDASVKVVNIVRGSSLVESTVGNILRVRFDNALTCNNPTLRVKYGTFDIYDRDTNNKLQSGAWGAGDIVTFYWDGSAVRAIAGLRATTTNYGETKLSSSVSSTSTTEAATSSAVKAAYDLANGKQDALVSGTNIKTINNQSLLGSGNINISGGGGSVNLSDFLAPAYNSSSTYDSGDIVIYDNDLYMCMDDSVTGTWDSTSWQAIKVSDLFGDLNYISYVTGDLPINMEYVVRWTENELNRKAYADNFASDYDSTSSYAVGDYVMKDGSLYKCNTAISGGETWNSSHWTFTPIATEVKEVYDTLGDIETLLGGI